MAQIDTPDGVSVDRQDLSENEQDRLENSFERGLEDTHTLDTEVVVEKMGEYMPEIEGAAQIARAQFDQKFGGLNPESGRFAISRIHSGYFGYDSWENVGELNEGELNDWIDDDTPDNLSSGDSGLQNPLKVGEDAVHVIMGVGTYHDSPKTTAIKMEVNESPRASVKTKYEFTRTDVQVKWFDRALILPENALFGAQLYADATGADFPFFVGVSFLESRAAQLADPSEMTDDSQSTQDNIVAQG